MSNEMQETIADIVDDIRAQNQGLPEDSYALSPLVCDLLSLADRIEAVAKRFYDKYKEHTDELNRQILVLKREKEMSDTHFCGGEFKTNKECADEYNASRNHEVAELRAENALLRSALKPVLECKVMSAMTAEIVPGKSEYCAAIIEKAQRIYNECEAKEQEGGAE